MHVLASYLATNLERRIRIFSPFAPWREGLQSPAAPSAHWCTSLVPPWGAITSGCTVTIVRITQKKGRGAKNYDFSLVFSAFDFSKCLLRKDFRSLGPIRVAGLVSPDNSRMSGILFAARRSEDSRVGLVPHSVIGLGPARVNPNFL